MRRLWLLAPLLLVGCGGEEGASAGEIEVDPATVREATEWLSGEGSFVVEANNRFTFDLFGWLVSETETENVVASPISVAMASQMVYEGARGQTAEQLASALSLYAPDRDELAGANGRLMTVLQHADETVRMDVANALYGQAGLDFEPDFLSAVGSDYRAEVGSLDFADQEAAIGIINAWVSEATRGTIPKLLETVPDDTVMALLNAVYFKADWTRPFDPEDTEVRPFMLDDGTEIEVATVQGDRRAMVADVEGTSVLRLGYGEGRFNAIFALPPSDADLDSWTQSLDLEVWNGWLEALGTGQGPVRFPIVDTDFTADLVPAMKALGAIDAFDPGAADLTGIAAMPGANLYLNKMMQRATLKINEYGTEASAATFVGGGATSMPPPFEFDANRPFLFALTDGQTDAILFVSLIRDPRN